MQTEEEARIARLKELLDEKQREIDQLRSDLEGLRVAIREVTSETFGVLDAVDRQSEAGKMRLERMLGRPFADTKLVDELLKGRVTS